MQLIETAKNIWRKRITKVVLFLFGVLVLLFVFRFPILRAMGSYLIVEDEEIHDIVFVLGGNSRDRGEAAAELFNSGRTKKLVCLGGNVPQLLEMMGHDDTESELSAYVVKEQGVPKSKFQVIKYGTSTFEEALLIAAYCKKYDLKKVTILSDLFHLRRVRWVMKKKLDPLGIEFTLHGVSNQYYKEEEWWKTEEGMLMVKNEYMKLLHYKINH